jgi:hypothetical protein
VGTRNGGYQEWWVLVTVGMGTRDDGY